VEGLKILLLTFDGAHGETFLETVALELVLQFVRLSFGCSFDCSSLVN